MYYFWFYSNPPRVIGFSLGLYYIVIAGMFSGKFVRLRREYAEKNRELILRNRQKDEFLANTSHELKTPLNGIIGIAESMLEGAGGVLEKEVAGDVQNIARSGRRLEAIVNSLLDLVFLKNEELQLQQSPCDLAAMITIVARIVSGGQDAESCVINKLQGTSFVLADEGRLIQVLITVFGYMRAGWNGRLVVKGYEAAGVVHVLVQRENSPENAGDLKSVVPDRTVSGSLRVELELAREIFRLHGGVFNLDWDSGIHPEVVFTLPVSPQSLLSSRPVPGGDMHVPEHFAAESHGGETNRQYMVVVVDDDPVNLHVVRSQLENEGMFVVTIQDSREVAKIIEKGVFPDLLILDVMMPYVSGYDICRNLRERYSLAELPVLMLTARNRTVDILTSFQAGANDFLAKPFEIIEMKARVRHLLALKDAIDTEAQYTRLQNEMNLAVRIQQAIMPEQLPFLDGVESHCLYRPFSALGGDFLDYLRDEQGIGIIIADVAGHGVAASIVAAMVKIAFSGQRALLKDPSMLMERMNSVLIQNTRNTYVTATYIYLDFAAGSVLVARAGHYPLLVIDRATGVWEEYGGKGRMLGRFKSAGCETVCAPLKAGQRLVLYTDCVLETRTPQGEMFGEERYFELARDSRMLEPGPFNERTVHALQQWLGPDEFDDDLTLIAIDINAVTEPVRAG